MDIDQLVRSVMADLGLASGQDAPQTVRPVAEVPVPTQVERPTELHLTERVITLQVIKEHEGSHAVRWILPSNAIITPSAKDEFKKRAIETVFGDSSSIITKSVAKTSDSGPSVPRTEPAVKSATTVNRSGFFVGIHESETLTVPVGFLSNLEKKTSFETIRNACIIQTIFGLRDKFQASGQGKGLILTSYPALAVMIANHQPELRAMAVTDFGQVKRDAPLLGANILVIDPKGTGIFPLKQITDWFYDVGNLKLPNFLAASGLNQ